ncbi:hypothetical protein cyc_06801 [Cyclospora cayetanensis]|uniref:Uncharacterized protein n=1 Tax=Cyclospora cayetanensis TaxID=88456 RepID=A0A1D3CU80_9EIME|nr:hypothetical protein cyc_06801 [Cyclospora cayetanensis]
MATSASSFGAATAVSLHKAGKALEAYLSGSLDCQQLLGCFYASAPGRRAFIEQAVASQTAARPKPLHAQLAAFAGLLSRALEAFAEAETADEGPQEGRLPTQPLEEVVFAGICATEFWLQHVQQLMALETAAAAVSVADGDGPSETGVVYKELERLVGPIAAAAAAPKLPLHTRKTAVDVLLLMAVIALGGPEGVFQGGPREQRNHTQQSGVTRRRQALRRVLRKALDGILSASGEGADGASDAMREKAVAALHTMLHWQGAARGPMRAALGPLAPGLLGIAQKGALMKSDLTAALGRSLLCRLTWIWRPSPRHGDQAQQEHQQRQLHSMSGGCLFSEVLNSAQQSVKGLLEASNARALHGDSADGPQKVFSQGPERFLLLRSLQLIRDLLLCGGGQTFPLQGAVSSSLSQLEADGGRFVLLNTQSLGETLLAAATSCCEVFAASVSAAAATLANSATKHPSASDTQLQRRSEASQQKEPPPTQQRPTRRGGLPPPVVLESSSSSEGESSGAGSAADSDSSTLDELSEAELSATNAAALEAAVQAAGALAEVGGSGGVLPCLQVFCSFLETLLSGTSETLLTYWPLGYGRREELFLVVVCYCVSMRLLYGQGVSATPRLLYSIVSLPFALGHLIVGANWRFGGLIARQLTLAEEGGLPSLLLQARLAMPPESKNGNHRQRESSSKGGLRPAAAEEALWDVHAPDNEALVLLNHAWCSTCRLLEELLYVQDVALVGSSALQLEAFIEALVLGILATNLSWNPSRGDQPLFAHVILSDPFSLVAALRLLTASISVCLPPLATLRAASSLHEQLLQLCSSGQGPLPGGFRLSSCWSLFEVPGDAHFSSSWSMLQQAAGHGPVTATGALEVALTDLGLAIRNAACTRSTEGAAAAGEAAIEAADGCASRFILRPEQLQVYQDTPAGGPKPAAALYNTCFSNSLNLSAPKVLGEPSRQGAGSCPQGSLWTSKRSSASVGGLRDIAGAHAASEAPGPSLVTKGHGDSVSEKCDTPDVGNGTYSRAAANASLSAVGAEPRRSTEDLTERSASFPPQQQHQNTPGLLLGGSLVCGEVEIEESGKKLCKRQRREQGHVSLSRSPSPYPVVIQRGDARSDDEVVILEDTTSHSAPKDKRNRFSEGRAAGEDPAIRQQQLPQATQQQPPDVSVSAEAQARARLNKLVQSDSDLSD